MPWATFKLGRSRPYWRIDCVEDRNVRLDEGGKLIAGKYILNRSELISELRQISR